MPNEKNDFDDDTEPVIRLPKVKPEVTDDHDPDEKNADSDLDDVEIEIDAEEVKAESEGKAPSRKN